MLCTWVVRKGRVVTTATQTKETFVATETRPKAACPRPTRFTRSPLPLLYKNPALPPPPAASAKFPIPVGSLRTRLGTLAPATSPDPAPFIRRNRPPLSPIAALRQLRSPAPSTRLLRLLSSPGGVPRNRLVYRLRLLHQAGIDDTKDPCRLPSPIASL